MPLCVCLPGYSAAGVFLGLPGLRFGTPASADRSFLGRPGLRFGFVCVFSFLGLPGLRFRAEDAVEPFKDSGVWVVVEVKLVEFVGPFTSFLGRPRLGLGTTGSGSGIGSIFRLPLFMRDKSGFTW